MTKDYVRPFVKAPKAWKGETSPEAVRLPFKWWTSFGDEMLNKMEDQALTNNLDLRIAIAIVDKVRAEARITQGDMYPTLEIDPKYNRSRISKNSSLFFTKSKTNNRFSVPLDFSYELDIWGEDMKHDWPTWRAMLPHYLGTRF